MTSPVGPRRPVVRPRPPATGTARPVVVPRGGAPRTRRPAAGAGHPAAGQPVGINREALNEAKRAAKPVATVLVILVGLLAVVGLGGMMAAKSATPTMPTAAASASGAGDPARIGTIVQDVLSFADDNTVVALLVAPFNATSPDGAPVQITWTADQPPPTLAAALTAGHTIVASTVRVGPVHEDAGTGLWACDFTVSTGSGRQLAGHAEGRINAGGGSPVVKSLTYSSAVPAPTPPSGTGAVTAGSSAGTS